MDIILFAAIGFLFGGFHGSAVAILGWFVICLVFGLFSD